MHKSIRIKFFLTFLFTTLLVVSGMYLFMRWSLDKGFNELVESRQHERVENLIESLSDYYADTGSWAALAANKRQWLQLLVQSDNHRHRHPAPWLNEALAEPGNRWPPDLDDTPERTRRFIPLEMRVMLLNAERSIIFGREDMLSELALQPIAHDHQVVGYLGLLPGRADNQLGELRFMERQTQAFAWIALLMIALSALLALLLAYLLGRPIKQIAAATKQLGRGAYNIRLPVESGDELGQLARDFNEMAAALEQSEQARRRWVADISHEFRTPLSILRGELEALQDGIRPMNPAAVDSLLADVMRLNRLTEDLYQLALSDQGALTYRKAMLEPVQILKADLSALQPEFVAKPLQVELVDHSQHALRLFADADRISQLFRNLLKNSLSYTDSGGRLLISISNDATQLIIVIADSAPAVDESELDKLFERFYRVEGSRNRNHGGAGLGLAICSNIVAAHNGSIQAQTSKLGGLAIKIEFPLAK
ncbi:two-component sensor histidine kinase [Methylomonas lenta]|uniref:histidine kinase n=1 Tax=Methylomonas lenta TaxID=980561 RepID=A0A177NVG2_9GAMM|nr:ATP-binding protein [Methylomonas lenta]OAI21812.1 two-component sensor histidine kinase [Methylomonas lenta]